MGTHAFKRERVKPNEKPQYGWNMNNGAKWSEWKYVTDDENQPYYLAPITGRSYDYGEDQFGNPFYIKYKQSWDDEHSMFDIYELDEDDMYTDKFGNNHFAEWSDNYDPSSTLLNDFEVYPKTGDLILKTHYPIVSRDYPFTGHSELSIIPDYYDPYTNNRRNLSMGFQDNGYNLVTNNCADATGQIIEMLTGKQINPWLFTTPGDVKDFLLENGGIEEKNGSVRFRLSEDQLIKAREAIDAMRQEWRKK